MDKSNTKIKRRSIRPHDDYRKSSKYKVCDELFIDLNKKKKFNEEDLKKIRRKFIRNFITSFLSRLTSYIISNMFAFVFLLTLVGTIIDSRSVTLNNFAFSTFNGVLMSIAFRIVVKPLNSYISFIRIDKKLSMNCHKDLTLLDRKEVYDILSIYYHNALKIILKKKGRVAKFSTHELLRLQVCKIYEDSPSYNYKCVATGIKPIPENMAILPFKYLIKLFRYINMDSLEEKEFKEVTRLLKASYTYDIEISLNK